MTQNIQRVDVVDAKGYQAKKRGVITPLFLFLASNALLKYNPRQPSVDLALSSGLSNSK
ncbi:hypothetical protein AT1219_30039 [Vibrio alginolyticus]